MSSKVGVVGGGGSAGARKNNNGIHDIPSGPREIVQSLKEIVNSPETEIYAMLNFGKFSKCAENCSCYRDSLDKIKRQLASGSGQNLLQGPLFKRSETLRKWNERWVILDPTTGKMEYKTIRNEPTIKGTIVFDDNSKISVSPVNFQGLPKYNGCCIYNCTHPEERLLFVCRDSWCS